MADENPWGQKKPQNIDDLVDEGMKKISELFNKKGSGNNNKNDPPNGPSTPARGSGFILLVVALVIIVVAGFKSVYQIQPGELGVVLRFGQYVRTESSGLNYLLPFLEVVKKVNVEEVRSISFGNSSQANDDSGFTRSRIQTESLILTGDLNVIHLNWVVQYRIKDPVKFLFNVRNPVNMVRDSAEFVVRRLVGNRDFDYVLNRREEVAFESQKEIQEIIDNLSYQTGIELVTVQLLDVTPPEKVRPSFNEVNEAAQDKTRFVNEAEKVANEQIPKARGVALQLVEEANGYAINRINSAKGDVARFNAIYERYNQYKDTTKTLLYIETMKAVIPTLQEVVVIENSNVLPLLNINKSRNTQ